MGKLFTDIEVEYQVHYKKYGNRVYINYFDKIEEAEEDYKEKLNDDRISSVELIECKPIKIYQK